MEQEGRLFRQFQPRLGRALSSTDTSQQATSSARSRPRPAVSQGRRRTIVMCLSIPMARRLKVEALRATNMLPSLASHSSGVKKKVLGPEVKMLTM